MSADLSPGMAVRVGRDVGVVVHVGVPVEVATPSRLVVVLLCHVVPMDPDDIMRSQRKLKRALDVAGMKALRFRARSVLA